MKRLARWTLNALTATAVLVCAVSLVLWVRSYFIGDYWDYYYGPSSYPRQRCSGIGSCRGAYLFETRWRHLKPQATWGKGVGANGLVHIRRSPPAQWGGALGFAHEIFNEHLRPDADGYAGTAGFHLVVPQWSVALLAAVLPVVRVILYRRRRLRSANACDRCAYDLTGNVSGVCPECGTKVRNV